MVSRNQHPKILQNEHILTQHQAHVLVLDHPPMKFLTFINFFLQSSNKATRTSIFTFSNRTFVFECQCIVRCGGRNIHQRSMH
jgi:hypothetical protein